MPSTAAGVQPSRMLPWPARLPLYYGWVSVVVAATAMSATLPGRTHGLGMISKPLTEDATLGVDELAFSGINFWAVLIGSALCLPVGRCIDRLGARSVLVGVVGGLALAVLGMSGASTAAMLFITLVLVRGLGQGALSLVSMALVGNGSRAGSDRRWVSSRYSWRSASLPARWASVRRSRRTGGVRLGRVSAGSCSWGSPRSVGYSRVARRKRSA